MSKHLPWAADELFSGVAYFNLYSSVNQQNFRYWADKNPPSLV